MQKATLVSGQPVRHPYITKLLKVMKLTGILLFTLSLHVAAKVNSQTIDFSGKDVPLRKIFSEVEKQTGFLFFYYAKDLVTARPVTVQANHLPLNDFLSLVFKDQPLKYRIDNRGIIVSLKSPTEGLNPRLSPEGLSPQFLPPPPITVRGRIVDEKGEPVIASIIIKGTNIGTTSLIDGSFVLTNVDENAILEISATNIEKTEWKVNGKEEFVIRVKIAARNLQDVIVTTAYGIEKRTKELGYSVATVKGEDLIRTNPGNILTGLTGRVAGLVISNQGVGMNPENNIMLRGLRSINATSNNQPLFILNGSPISFGSDQGAASLAAEFINNLNPNDIDEITVLKGANGSALYGPEGVNGVIIINTKRGARSGLSLNFRTSTNLQLIDWRKRKIQEKFGAGELVDAQDNPIYNPTGETLWGPAYNGQLVPLGRPDENGEVQMVPYRYNKDRQRFWNSARNTQNYLSISQADNQSDFYLGINYTDQSGLMPGDKQHRVGVLLNTARQLKHWSVRFNMGYSNTNSDKGPANLKTDYIPPHVPLLSYIDFNNNRWADRNHYWSDQNPNPYEAIYNNRTKTGEQALSGSLEFKVKPLQWLTVTERPGITFSSSDSKSTSKPLDYSDFAKEQAGNGRYISYTDKKASLAEKMLNNFAINNDLLLTGISQFANVSVKTTLGNTVRQNYIKDLRGLSSSLILPVYNFQFGNRDQTMPYERSELSRFYSLFGTILLGFQEKIFVEVTGRNDWDSKLAIRARNKNFYSGINSSVVLNEVFPFLQNLKWLTTARLRASLTRTANMNIKPYQSERLLQSEGPIGPSGELIGYSYMANIPNPNINPEKITSQEYGGALSFLEGKINADIAYYKQRNRGLILDVINSLFSGAPTIDNAGVYDNSGWEFELNFKQLFKTAGGVTAHGGLRLALNDNKVVSLPPSYDGQLSTYAGGTEVVARTGKHAFEFALHDWVRDTQGNIIVDKVTGIPQVDFQNPLFMGRTSPKYTASANFGLQWRRFNFSFLAEYRGGNYQYNAFGDNSVRSGLSLLTTYNNRMPFIVPNSVYEDPVLGYVENKEIKISSIKDYYMQASFVSSNFLINAGFLTLKEMSVSYELKFPRKSLKTINIGVYGRDLLSFYAKDNIYGDPQLVLGPGAERDKGLFDQSNQSNFGSASSNFDRLPGTMQFGFVVNIGF
jgi:TonB-linked SusC/RagA family outer membrane protein